MLISAQKVTLSGIRVTDFRGVVVASTGGDVGMSIANQHEVRRALEGNMSVCSGMRIDEEPTSPPIH